MDDLKGLAAERLEQFLRIQQTESPSAEWLSRQLLTALRELAVTEPIAAAEEDRREDY